MMPNNKKVLIELAGYAGAGKTTFAKELIKQLKKNKYSAFNFDEEKSRMQNEESKVSRLIWHMLCIVKNFKYVFLLSLTILSSKPRIKYGIFMPFKSYSKAWFFRPFLTSKGLVNCNKEQSVYILEDGFFQSFLGTVGKTQDTNYKKYLSLYEEYFTLPDILVILECDKQVIEERIYKRGIENIDPKQLNNVLLAIEEIKNNTSNYNKAIQVISINSNNETEMQKNIDAVHNLIKKNFEQCTQRN
jgi:deoxyadenosine/deoxycytidine kinase